MAFTELTLVPKGYTLSNSALILGAPSLDQAAPPPVDFNTPYAVFTTGGLKPFDAVCATNALSTVAIGHLPYADKAIASATASTAAYTASKVIGYAIVQTMVKDEAVSLLVCGMVVDYTIGAGATTNVTNIAQGSLVVGGLANNKIYDMTAYIGWPVYLSAFTAGGLCVAATYAATTDVQVGGPSSGPAGYVLDDHRIYLYAIK